MTSPQDPAGLLERIPELAQFLDYPPVVRAVERGDPHAVYRALYFGKQFGPLRDKRDQAEVLLSQRRLFVTPIKRSPVLTTVNGVGCTVYGGSELAHDGTYVKSHFLVFFFVPLIPLAQYLVTDAATGKGWHFIGKVPFSPLLYVWRRLLALAALGAALMIGFAVFHASRHNTLRVVNGLPAKVHVVVGGKPLELEPQQIEAIELDVGTLPIEVKSSDGKVIESGTVQVKRGVDVLAWNIAGAAPIYRESIVYSESKDKPKLADPQVLCGKQQVELDDVDYVFEEPPSTLSRKKGSSDLTKIHVGVAEGGVDRCLWELDSSKDAKGALALSMKLAELEDYQGRYSVHQVVGRMASVQGGEALLTWLKALRASHDDNIEVHRAYQQWLSNTGKVQPVIAEYRARLAQHPDDPDAAYLLARLLQAKEAVAMYEDVLAKAPNHTPSLRGLMHASLGMLDYEKSVDAWRRMSAVDGEGAVESGYYAATAYSALGRANEALPLLERYFDQVPDTRARYHTSVMYARIAYGAGEGNPLALHRKLNDGEISPKGEVWTRVRAGQRVPEAELNAETDEDARKGLRLLWLTPQDPSWALNLVALLDGDDLRALDEESWALLYAEALRRDPQGKAAQLLPRWVGVSPETAQAVAAFVATGVADEQLEQLESGARAALLFVRSRQSDLSKSERARLRDEAERRAAVPGILTRAFHTWGG